jgi:hypothetical protein
MTDPTASVTGPRPETAAPRRSDRRRATRYRCAPAAISRLYVPAADSSYYCAVNNVSTTGVGLIAPGPMDAGEAIFVQFRLPQPNQVLNVLAEVVHCAQQPDATWAVGCRFSRPLTDDQLDAVLD